MERYGEMVGDVLPADSLADVLLLVPLKETGTPNLERRPPRPRLRSREPSGDRIDEQQRITALEVERVGAKKASERGALAPGRGRQDRPRRPLHEGQALRVSEDARRGLGRNELAALRRVKIVSEVDERLCEWAKALVGGRVQHRHLVVAVDRAASIEAIDLADAFHAEDIELGGAQGAEARRAQDADSALECYQDLAVENGRDVKEVAIDDPDHIGRLSDQAKDIALLSRRQHLDVGFDGREPRLDFGRRE
jgi:hypothetical protein